MAVINARIRFAAAVVGLAASLSACNVHKTEVPALTGPSTLGLNITIAAAPDVLTQDGVSTSTVMITAFDSNGQPKANINLRVDVAVGGVVTDFGRLSAKSAVTDASGRAALVYQAPPPPAVAVGNGTRVDIEVTPLDSNFDNATTHAASILLMPPGVIPAPRSALVPDFVAPSPNAGDAASFSATVTDPTNSHQTVAQYSWNFGDGSTASGQALTHVFSTAGTLIVSLTITDNLGRTATVSRPVTIAGPAPIVATFFTTPAFPSAGKDIIFNASQTAPPAGHTITGYFWDFGDGSDGATGAVVTHRFASAGTYTVLLRVTLDNGAQGTTTQQLTITP